MKLHWFLAAFTTGRGVAPHIMLSRRHLVAGFASASTASLLAQRTYADDTLINCRAECFKECNALAPGNKKYCASQCDSYCEEAGPVGSKDVVRSDLSNAVDNTKKSLANTKVESRRPTDASATAKVSIA